jgi:hypothetical protein
MPPSKQDSRDLASKAADAAGDSVQAAAAAALQAAIGASGSSAKILNAQVADLRRRTQETLQQAVQQQGSTLTLAAALTSPRLVSPSQVPTARDSQAWLQHVVLRDGQQQAEIRSKKRPVITIMERVLGADIVPQYRGASSSLPSSGAEHMLHCVACSFKV